MKFKPNDRVLILDVYPYPINQNGHIIKLSDIGLFGEMYEVQVHDFDLPSLFSDSELCIDKIYYRNTKIELILKE